MGGLLGKSQVVLDFTDAEETKEGSVSASSAAGAASAGSRAHLQELIREGRACLAELRGYEPASDVISEALNSPGDAARAGAALDACKARVEVLKRLLTFSEHLGSTFYPTLVAIHGAGGIAAAPERGSLLARLLALTLEIDGAKMRQPAILNDFAYFKRAIAGTEDYSKLPLDEAGVTQMSIFLQPPSIMAHCINERLRTKLLDHPDHGVVLSELADCCRHTLAQNAKNGNSKPGNAECARAMVNAIATFELGDARGAFVKGSPVPTLKCLKQLASYTPDREREGLKTLLRNCPRAREAPANIRRLIARA